MTATELEAAIAAVPFVREGPLWLRASQRPVWIDYRADCIPWGHGCRQCGKAIRWRKATCSHRCNRLFAINHFWGDARQHAAYVKTIEGYTLERWLANLDPGAATNPDFWDYREQWHALRVCPKCDKRLPPWDLEVNHIHPLNGIRPTFGCCHHQDNLEAVCHECHVEITTEQRRAGLIGPPKAPNPQLSLAEALNA